MKSTKGSIVCGYDTGVEALVTIFTPAGMETHTFPAAPDVAYPESYHMHIDRDSYEKAAGLVNQSKKE